MVPELLHQIVAEDDCLIVFGVSRAIQKRHGLFRRGVQYRLPASSIVIQFVLIASPEFAPALGVVPEPVAKFIARRYLLEPAVEAQRFLLDASRPKPVDQEMDMPVIACVLIDALNIDCVFHDRDTPVFARDAVAASSDSLSSRENSRLSSASQRPAVLNLP